MSKPNLPPLPLEVGRGEGNHTRGFHRSNGANTRQPFPVASLTPTLSRRERGL